MKFKHFALKTTITVISVSVKKIMKVTSSLIIRLKTPIVPVVWIMHILYIHNLWQLWLGLCDKVKVWFNICCFKFSNNPLSRNKNALEQNFFFPEANDFNITHSKSRPDLKYFLGWTRTGEWVVPLLGEVSAYTKKNLYRSAWVGTQANTCTGQSSWASKPAYTWNCLPGVLMVWEDTTLVIFQLFSFFKKIIFSIIIIL